MQWINGIEARKRLAAGGNHLLYSGRVLRSQNETEDRPYVALNESVTGYIIILASDIDDATLIARECPILNGTGTSVEIRQAAGTGI